MNSAQHCPICKHETAISERYPSYVCKNCVEKAVDESGLHLKVENDDSEDRVCVLYKDNDEPTNSLKFLIEGQPCYAQEAYFGGVVVQVISQTKLTTFITPQHAKSDVNISLKDDDLLTQSEPIFSDDDISYDLSTLSKQQKSESESELFAQQALNAAVKMAFLAGIAYILIIYLFGITGFFRDYSLVVALFVGWLTSRVVISTF